MGILHVLDGFMDVGLSIACPENAQANWVSTRYSTMDNIDGKQARRTGSSSPLGELFELALSTQIT